MDWCSASSNADAIPDCCDEGENHGTDPEFTGGITYHSWPGSASRSPRKSWRMWLKRSGLPYLTCCHHKLDPNKWQEMDGLMDRYN